MPSRTLRETLGLITLCCAACGGRIVPDGDTGSPPQGTTSPPLDTGCPHTVELRAFDLQVPEYDACVLANDAPGCFSTYCQPAGKDCGPVCGDPAVSSCRLPPEFLRPFRGAPDGGMKCSRSSATVSLHCAVTQTQGTKQSGCPVEGRRPSSLVDDPERSPPTSVGEYFAECAWLEAASVIAFRELAAALGSLDAPAALVEDCAAAARDEERHAALAGALTTRFDGEPRAVVLRRERGPRTPFALALENGVEGVVREMFGAAVALWRADHATDPLVVAAMREIAEDECAHADLSLRVAAFLDSRLTPDERTTVERARGAAIRQLAMSIDEPAAAVSAAAGAPLLHQARGLLQGLITHVWAAGA
jgi:hypothetical protein